MTDRDEKRAVFEAHVNAFCESTARAIGGHAYLQNDVQIAWIWFNKGYDAALAQATPQAPEGEK